MTDDEIEKDLARLGYRINPNEKVLASDVFVAPSASAMEALDREIRDRRDPPGGWLAMGERKYYDANGREISEREYAMIFELKPTDADSMRRENEQLRAALTEALDLAMSLTLHGHDGQPPMCPLQAPYDRIAELRKLVTQ